MTTISPQSWRANTIDPIGTYPGSPTSDPTTGETGGNQSTSEAELLRQLDEAQRTLLQLEEENSESLTQEQRYELHRLEATMKAESAAISAYGAGRANGTSADGASGDGNDDLMSRPTALVDGWNGDFIQNSDANDQGYIENHPQYGSYAGTIEIVSSGTPDPTKIAYSLSPDTTAVYGESHGRDMLLTAIKKDGTRETWVVREGSVRPEPIIIDGTRAAQGVTVDLSRAYRISAGDYNTYPGSVSGFYIWGSNFDDRIIASEGDDKIAASGGNDVIFGMAGNDQIWGDEYNDQPGFDPDGGNDTISGGTGSNILRGGGGIDTRYRSDNPDDNSNQYSTEFERIIDDISGAIPEGTSWLGGSGDWEVAQRHDEQGLIEIENSGENGGTININMVEMPGYTMAFGERDENNNLIITFVGSDAQGNPKSFRARFNDFFAERDTGSPQDDVVTLNVTGTDVNDIIDFSPLRNNAALSGQVININGGSGDDILLGAENALLRDGLDLARLTESQGVNNAELTQAANGLIPDDGDDDDEDDDADVDADSFSATASDDGNRIVINPPASGSADQETLNLITPAGYNHAYIMENQSDPGGYYLILVKPGNPAESIVVEIPSSLGLQSNDISITLAGNGPDGQGNGASVTPISIPSDVATGFSLDGGMGDDLLYGQEGTPFNTSGDEGNDSIIRFHSTRNGDGDPPP